MGDMDAKPVTASEMEQKENPSCVDIGTPFAVSKLLNDTGRLCQGTHGVLTDTITGQFRKKEVGLGFLGYILPEGVHEILMEYGGLSLKEFVETQKWREMLPQTVVMQLAVQGFSALQYMHQYMIFDLGIQPETILIFGRVQLNLVIKLGTSHTPQQAVSHEGWTPEYMSPEACQNMMVSEQPDLSSMFQNFELSGKSDVFSFCLTLYFMLEGRHVVLDIWKDLMYPKNYGHSFIRYLARFPDYICEYIVGKGRPVLVDKLFTLTLAGDPLKRVTAKEAKDFIQQCILAESVTLPNIPSLRSPESTSSPEENE